MSKRNVWIGIAAGAAVIIVVAALLFQPWKLFTNTEVVEANPFAAAGTSGTQAGGAAPATAPGNQQAPKGDATAGPGVTASGSFKGLAHPTSGTAKVGTAANGATVVFLENLSTDNGPDLKLYLSPSADGEVTGGVNLGDLKGNKGSQSYSVPTGTDLSKYKGVVIWCERFSVGFGVAALSPA